MSVKLLQLLKRLGLQMLDFSSLSSGWQWQKISKANIKKNSLNILLSLQIDYIDLKLIKNEENRIGPKRKIKSKVFFLTISLYKLKSIMPGKNSISKLYIIIKIFEYIKYEGKHRLSLKKINFFPSFQWIQAHWTFFVTFAYIYKNKKSFFF